MNIQTFFQEKSAVFFLAIARIVLGLMLLWAFFDKLFGFGYATPSGRGWINGYSPSEGFLTYADGWLAPLFNALSNIFQVCDVLLMLGFLVLGITLVFGFASKLTTLGTVILMSMFYLAVVPSSTNPLLDQHLIYILVVLAVYAADSFSVYGFEEKWKELGIVKSYPVLE